MKQVLILLLSFGVTTAVFSQRNNRGFSDYNKSGAPVVRNNLDFRKDRGSNEYGRVAYDAAREHQLQLARINQTYDQRIIAVQYSRMRPAAKAREMRRLERERNEQLRQCNMSFSKSYDQRDNRYAHSDRRGW
jgi:hypothetical protein